MWRPCGVYGRRRRTRVPYRESLGAESLRAPRGAAYPSLQRRTHAMSQDERAAVAEPPGGTSFDRRAAEMDLKTVYAPLDEATTLPGRYYHDPAILREELRLIFNEM